jgi:uncharacterized damage-inducible protein DinB
MKKQQILDKLEGAWGAFTEACAGLSDEQLLEPGVTGGWSVKDILAHVSWWEEEALKHLPHILQGVRPPRYSVTYGGIDAFNAQMTEQKHGLTLAEVRRQHAETHRRLMEFLQGVPEEQFTTETRFRRRLKLDTYSHYPIHTLAIQSWRQHSV